MFILTHPGPSQPWPHDVFSGDMSFVVTALLQYCILGQGKRSTAMTSTTS